MNLNNEQYSVPNAKRACTTPSLRPEMPMPTPSKAIIKARTCVDISAVPSKCIQAALDACLHTTGFRGFSIHRETHTMSVGMTSLDAVGRLQMLKQIVPPDGKRTPVQAYLASDVDLRRYVVAGVDPREDLDTLRKELFCPQHTIVASRHMGKSSTCLVTAQGPLTPPEKMYYYGCILRARPFKSAVIFCYGCYKKGT
ncbi:hypothetical protein HPB49_019235 [Dermacentor silvarum]|uniref:Uncharacterized protein n=1 Tax=Dermacentor silvarum TaxID=543639 RepID=A0ACB8DFL2_DERSI|nr:hypothetical protein HPB49_019235 [Dermacentor silvarum]